MMSNEIFLSFFILLALNLCLIFALRLVAFRINLLDHPGGRKTHVSPTPLVGGLAIYLTLLAAVAVNNAWTSDFAIITLCAGLVFFIGLVDDIKNVSWVIRLVFQLIATVFVIFLTDIEISYLGSYPLIGPIQLDAFSVVFTLLAVLGLTNAFNLIDGINGLCAGLLLVPIVGLIAFQGVHVFETDFFLIILLGCICTFLLLNLADRPKTNIFLGDAGSSGMGFIISFLTIGHFQNPEDLGSPPLALWLLLVPVMDTIHVIARRASNGQSIFQPGVDHLHHRLLKAGYSRKMTFLYLCFVAVLGAILGGILENSSDFMSVCIFVIVLIFLPKFLYLEKD